MEAVGVAVEWSAAVAVRLINDGWFRVGNERYARSYKTFGITTLRKGHVGCSRSACARRGCRSRRRACSGTAAARLADRCDELAEAEPAKSETAQKRTVATVMRKVGETIGNTPAVARASYVSPAVVEQYLDGRTIDDFRPRYLRVVGARDLELDTEEQVLLSLLRSWRIRRARAAARDFARGFGYPDRNPPANGG